MFNESKKYIKRSFSLIELLIVIAIMAALTGLILPSFSDSESASKDTACDYNNAGTLRYLTMFQATNGVYPSGFHTGTDSAAASVTEAEGAIASMAEVTRENMKITEALVVEADDNSYGQSLQESGIATLAYGKIVAQDIGTVTAVRAISGDWSETMNADGSYKSVIDGAAPITIKGIALSAWVAAGNAPTWNPASDAENRICRKNNEPSFKLVPLFVATTLDWERAYPYQGLSQKSKISIAMEGRCPWLDAGAFRYYIAIFKVYEDGTAAKLIATACPECGILDADNF